VFANRDSSITDIAARTALPQSYVSDSVASLQREGFVETRTDIKDRRRTLVRVTTQHRRTVARKGAAPIDAALSKALGEAEADQVNVTLELLQMLAERLRPEHPGPILSQLQQHKGSPTSA
jgi:DNA-binding MarR family transcriptional regulator